MPTNTDVKRAPAQFNVGGNGGGHSRFMSADPSVLQKL